jgi:hypothetical protein
VSEVDLTKIEAAVAEARRRQALREQGAKTFSNEPALTELDRATLPDGVLSGRALLTLAEQAVRVIDADEIGNLEKAIEHACDKLTLALNGRIVKFSHPGKTKQTPGVADRIYAFPRLALITWWEHKTPENKQDPAQVDFEQLVTSCGHEYHAGGLGDYKQWLVTRGVVAGFSPDGTPLPVVPTLPTEAP